MNPPNTIASDTLVEAIARAMEPHVNDEMGEPFKSAWLADLAQAALTALTEAGYAVVPVEPTEAMRSEGADRLFASAVDDWGDEAADIYRAMVNAAQAPHIMPPPMRDSGPLESEEGE